MSLLFEIYGESTLTLYAVCDKEKLSFLVLGKQGNLYIDENGYKAFTSDNANNIVFYKGKNYDVFFDGDIVTFRDSRGFAYGLSFTKLENEEEGYTGEVIFNQYNPFDDSFCQTSYHQMYNEIDGKAPIYSYHTKEPTGVYLENKRSKNKIKFGLVPNSIQSYNMYTFDRDTIGYDRMLIHDYGLIKFLSTNKYSLERTGKIQKYIKCRFVFGDKFYDGWPFPSIHEKSEVLDLVRQKEFLISIPEEMIEFYNGYNYDLNNLRSVMNSFGKIHDKSECEMELTLKKSDE
jgi:hypothetical protein